MGGCAPWLSMLSLSGSDERWNLDRLSWMVLVALYFFYSVFIGMDIFTEIKVRVYFGHITFLFKFLFSEFLFWTECRWELLIQSLCLFQVIVLQFEKLNSRIFFLSHLDERPKVLSCLWLFYRVFHDQNVDVFPEIPVNLLFDLPSSLLHLLVDYVTLLDLFHSFEVKPLFASSETKLLVRYKLLIAFVETWS